MKCNQRGQAAVEFAVSISALLALVLAIPIVAKIANANIMSIQALDYAAWRVREGNTDNVELSREVNDRYFGETALIVDDEQIDHQGANLGKGRNNEKIYVNNTVSIQYEKDESKDSWEEIIKEYNFDLYDKTGNVSINLPLENLDVLPEIPSSLVIEKSLFVDNQALTSRDNIETKNTLNNVSPIILPYNSGVQEKYLNDPTNIVIRALRLIPMDVFDDYTLNSIEVDNNAVPQDRLVEFNP